MIYAVMAEETGFIKFGYTANITKRISQMQTGCPFTLTLLTSCKGNKAAESWIHWRLCKAQAFQRGEWFKDCPEAQAIIEEMKANALKAEPVNTQGLRLEQRHKRLGAALALSDRKAGEWAQVSKRKESSPQPSFSSRAREEVAQEEAVQPILVELMRGWVGLQDAATRQCLISLKNQYAVSADSSVIVEESRVSA